jgi:para-aminobenzoate synthetase component I
MVSVDGRPVAGNPLAVLQAELARWRLPPGAAPVPFGGGAVGFLGYGLRRDLEHLPDRHPNDLAIPDMVVGFYDLVLAFDRYDRRAWLQSSGFPATEAGARRTRAQARADAALRRLDALAPAPADVPVPALAWTAELTRPGYLGRVSRVLEYIAQGDIFQANFTTRFLAPRPPAISAASLYAALRAASPAPFAAYLGCGDRLAIASVSPERFLRLDATGRIETRPIKGTRPRSPDPQTDAALRRALAASVKDRAENLMIVDLMRNDIGRVAEIGSVTVPALWEVESFAAVHHLVSSVEGQLRPGLGPVDLLRAAFPGGSITGAPKIRAMEIIDELEVAARGVYCGAVVWIGFDGAMDSSIAIRTLTITPEIIAAQAGGGIVADSDPADEYDEMLVKLRPLLNALGKVVA